MVRRSTLLKQYTSTLDFEFNVYHPDIFELVNTLLKYFALLEIEAVA